MELETKSVPCGTPGTKGGVHNLPFVGSLQACGNCGNTGLIHVGTSSVTRHVKGWCEDRNYCKDCKYITWAGHATHGDAGKWYGRQASEKEVEWYES
jgi:hypothetical protein